MSSRPATMRLTLARLQAIALIHLQGYPIGASAVQRRWLLEHHMAKENGARWELTDVGRETLAAASE